jgi:beta-galactosidase
MLGSESLAMEALENWQAVEKNPYVIGDFIWTGMDYLGESGIGHSVYNENKEDEWLGLPPWPWYNGNCGDIDIIGNKKPQSYFRDVVWKESKLEMAVHEPIPESMFEHISQWGWPREFQSWNWEGNEGAPMQVAVYTQYEEVRLELNGRVIGTRSVSEDTKLTARFEVPYEAGELTAIGLTDGKEIARNTLVTTGKPFQLKLTAEHDTITASPNDLAYFNVEVLDENGILVPNAEITVVFSIEGNYTLQAVGNANPTDMHSFQQPQVNTFQGRCQLIMRSSDHEGQMSVTASSTDLKPSESTVTVIGVNRK